MTKLLYLDDSNTLEFKADVTCISPVENGNFAAELSQTFFYPTGGGQDHDVGWLGEAKVIDVVKQNDEKILHILDKSIDIGENFARIDGDRRLINKQAHTAQHILSRTFELHLGLKTLSSNINAVNPSTIDLNILSIPELDLQIVETLANSIVQNNLEVKTYSVSDKEVSSIPFRRPPKVSGLIRVVEIENYDYSACGGTHCDHTGSIGIIKIIKTEIQNHKLRVHFFAGKLALEDIQKNYITITSIANILETGSEVLENSVINLKNTIHQLQLKMEDYKKEYFELKINQLLKKSIKVGDISLIEGSLNDIDSTDIRTIASLIRSKKGYLIVLSSFSNLKFSLVVACSDNVGLNARQILSSLLIKYDGKGGGDAFLAQGGGKYSPDGSENLAQESIKILEELSISK